MSESIEKTVSQLITMVGKVLEGQTEMKADIAGIKTEIADMKADITGMKTDIAYMKADMAHMKTEMAYMKGEISEANADRAEIRDTLNDINTKLTYLVSDVDLLEKDNLQNKKEINRIKKHLEI